MKHSVNIMINFSTGSIYCKSVHASLSLTQSWSVSGETCHWSLNCQLSDKTQLFGCFLKTFYTMAPMCSESTSLYTLLWKKANHPSLHCAWVVTKINCLTFILLWKKKSACQRHQLLRVFALAEIQWTVILMHRPASRVWSWLLSTLPFKILCRAEAGKGNVACYMLTSPIMAARGGLPRVCLTLNYLCNVTNGC